MANALQTNFGRANLSTGAGYGGAGDKYELYLKLFSGEMFKGFQHNTIARDLVTKRTLKNGKSLQFIYTGRMGSEYHTPGTPILGTDKTPVAEKTIVMDDLLISSAFVYDLDETLSHYDLRGEISRKIGYALAENYDRKIFRAITRGARAEHPVTGSNNDRREPGGTQIQVSATGTNEAATTAASLVTAFFNAAAVLDEKGISSDGRVAVLNPRQYYALIKETGDNGLINRDVQGTGLQTGEGVVSIAGIKIFKSMNIPFLGKFGTANTIDNAGDFVGPAIDSGAGSQAGTYVRTVNTGVTVVTKTAHGLSVGDKITFNPTAGTATAGAYTITAKDADTFTFTDSALTTAQSSAACTFSAHGVNNNYGESNDFAGSCGLIFQREGAGVVEAIGPQVQTTSGDVSVIYQGDVILGRFAMGADYLNPAACVELFVGSSGDAAF